MSFFETATFYWSVAGIIGVALAIIVLTEIIDRLRRRNHPLASVAALTRNVVLLLAAVLFLQRVVIGMDNVSLPVRLVATAGLVSAIVVIVRFFGHIFSEGEGPTWHDQIPRLFKRLPVYTLVIFILWYILQRVWNLPLNEYAAALGLGSIAVAFALQDTLSNLVSGLFILFNRPFAEGEWIHIGETEGKVLTVNWRYTSIETRNGDVVVFPNGSISNASITNHSQPQPRTRVVESIVVAYVNPPNKVKHMFMETMLETPGILADPPPVIAVTSIDDPLMGYEIRYWIENYADKPAIHNAFMTRIWYAARRHDVALPSPAYDLYHYNGPKVAQESEVTPAKIEEMLRQVETFNMLDRKVIQELAENAVFREYAISEEIVHAGTTEEGISVLIRGRVRLMLPGSRAQADSPVDELGPGGVFGETGLFSRAISPYTVIAVQDVELVRLPYETATEAINRHPDFAAGVNAFVNRRRQTIQQITDSREAQPRTASSQGDSSTETSPHTNGHSPITQGSAT